MECFTLQRCRDAFTPKADLQQVIHLIVTRKAPFLQIGGDSVALPVGNAALGICHGGNSQSYGQMYSPFGTKGSLRLPTGTIYLRHYTTLERVHGSSRIRHLTNPRHHTEVQ